MRRLVFYSWQSDLPNSTNRGFIQTALEDAGLAITADETIEVEAVIDRDTQGIPGSPDIALTIFSKITSADIFVADVSITTRPKNGRATPNPNVLIELGYALKALGHEKVILVFNKAFGKFEELPFDLRTRRLTTYEMSKKDQNRAKERTALQKHFDTAIRSALSNSSDSEEPSLGKTLIQAIESDQKNKILLIRKFLDEIFVRFERNQPIRASEGGTEKQLIEAIAKTQEIVAEFTKVIEVIAAIDSHDCVLEVHRWFGKIFEQYYLPPGYSGRYNEGDFDYFKFLGHELYVSLIAVLLREQRDGAMIEILDEPLLMQYLPNKGPGNVYWNFASEYLYIIDAEGKKANRTSLHADILQARHTSGGLATVMPFAEFVSADYFLFLYSEIPPAESASPVFLWRPWSALYLKHAPSFLIAAERKKNAEKLCKLLKIKDIMELKRRLSTRVQYLDMLFGRRSVWSQPIKQSDIDALGTK